MKKGFIGFALVALVLVIGAMAADSDDPVSIANVEVIPTVFAQTENFTYESFSQERFDSLKGSEAFSVFVHNKACGTCAKKNNQIIDEAEEFSAGTILKMEFSKAPKEFLEKYNVAGYDTFVNFAADGSFETVRGGKVDDVRAEIGNDEIVLSNSIASNAEFVYADFSEDQFDELKGSEDFAVFVHSRTCGTCAKKDKQIKDEVAQFDSGTILKMEYDEASAEFLKEYGVAKWDTFVTFSSDGSFETRPGASVEDVRLAI